VWRGWQLLRNSLCQQQGWPSTPSLATSKSARWPLSTKTGALAVRCASKPACELCIPACPVDCIEIEIVTPGKTGWQAWSAPEAAQALERYEFHSSSRYISKGLKAKAHEKALQDKLADLPAHSRITDSVVLDKKRGFIEAALQKARDRSAKA
jgi:NAD-dependent dihydropyrimidine dehydrogenase PreA subunit